MRKIKEIERQIQTLSAAEFSELRDWLLDRDWRQWDAQIASDISAGKLDDLATEALAEHKAGKSRASRSITPRVSTGLAMNRCPIQFAMPLIKAMRC